MSRVAIISEKQKQLLSGRMYDDNSYFNPIQDGKGNWIISEEEIANVKGENFQWIKGLELTEYLAPTTVK